MLQDKIHRIPVSNTLMATSSSTASAVPLLRWRRLFTKLQFIRPRYYEHTVVLVLSSCDYLAHSLIEEYEVEIVVDLGLKLGEAVDRYSECGSCAFLVVL